MKRKGQRKIENFSSLFFLRKSRTFSRHENHGFSLLRKKGIGEVALVEIIVGILVVIVVLALFGKVISKADRATADAVCKDSVLLREKAILNIDVWPFPTAELKINPIVCTTYATDLKEKSKMMKKEDVLKEISYEMKNCWNRFGEGKLPHTVSLSSGTIEQQGDYCFRCAAITMPIIVDDNGLETTIEFKDIINYLHNNKIDEKESYYDYVTKHDNVPGRLGFFADKIKSYHTYEIFYSDWGGNVPNGIYLNDLENGAPQSWVFLGRDWNLIGREGVSLTMMGLGGACVIGGYATAGAALVFCGGSIAAGATALGFQEAQTPDCGDNCKCHIISDSEGK